MKIILSSLLVAALATTAFADPALDTSQREQTAAFVELKAAREQVAAARARWDAAVADGHPVEAGVWARRHFEAMQTRATALSRLQTATNRVDATRFAAR